MIAKFVLCAVALASFVDAAAAQSERLPYPPANMPLYLSCKVQGVNDSRAYADWDRLELLFPNGTNELFAEIQVHDTKNLLHSSKLSFQMKSEGHWSIYATDKVPSSGAALDDLFSIMFLPPSGQGENLKIVLSNGREPTHAGVCFGLIGDESSKAFEHARSSNNEQK